MAPCAVTAGLLRDMRRLLTIEMCGRCRVTCIDRLFDAYRYCARAATHCPGHDDETCSESPPSSDTECQAFVRRRTAWMTPDDEESDDDGREEEDDDGDDDETEDVGCNAGSAADVPERRRGTQSARHGRRRGPGRPARGAPVSDEPGTR